MQTLPYPIYLIVDDSGYIRFTNKQDACTANLLAIFSLHDLIKLHFLLLQFRHRGAVFLLEAGGTGFYKSRKNCIPGDRWCIGVGLSDAHDEGGPTNQIAQWFRCESRRVSYRVNPDIRVWITWPAMWRILATLGSDVYAILERENYVAPRRFIQSDDPMLEVLGPSSENIAYLKAVCASIFTEQAMPILRSIDKLCVAIGHASKNESITARATKIPKGKYASFYKTCAGNATDADIARGYGVSVQSVRRTLYSINVFVYKCRERAWNAWDMLFEELIDKYHQEP